jgi:hypothetical protein
METGSNFEMVSLHIDFGDHMRRFPSVRCEVIMAVRMNITGFWEMTQCSLVDGYQRFDVTYCPHHRGSTKLHVVRPRKHVLFIIRIITFPN